MNDQPQHPHHSSDTSMSNATPVQSFVSPPSDPTAEDLARPRLGRPVRPVAPDATKPASDSPSHPAPPVA